MSRQRPDPLEIAGDFGPLFTHPVPTGPLYAPGDKRTSAQAAAALKSEPERLGGLQREALELVTEFPGRTCVALASIAQLRRGDAAQGLEWYRQRIGRRLSELEAHGLIHSGEAVIETTGRAAVSWWPGARPEEGR